MEEKENINTSMDRLEEAFGLLKQMNAVDKEKGYKRIVQPVKGKNTRRKWIVFSRYAAVFVLLVASGIFWSLTKKQPEAVSLMQAREITHGEIKAQLVLATGKSVVLDTSFRETEMILDAGATIQKNKGVLTYGKNTTKAKEESPVAYNTLVVPRGGEYDVVLEDGTRVWLNADSRLKYPVVFSGNERRVVLEGEAYFEVAKDADRPFLVETGIQTLTVLGTAFNVCAYPEENDIYTTLVRGSIAVSLGEKGERRVLVPGEQALCDVSGESFTVNKVNVSQVVSWKEGLFVFEEQNLEQIMMKLARWYNVNVFFLNEEAKNIRFKGNLPKYSDFKLILRVIEKSSKVKFEVKDRNVIVSI